MDGSTMESCEISEYYFSPDSTYAQRETIIPYC